MIRCDTPSRASPPFSNLACVRCDFPRERPAQPQALWNASVVKNSFKRILVLFVPVTLVSTPLGNLLAEHVPTKTIQAVAGVLVGIVAVWEMYSKRKFFLSLCGKENEGKGREGGGEGGDATKGAKGDGAKANDLEEGQGGENKQSTAKNFEGNPKSQTQADESELEAARTTSKKYNEGGVSDGALEESQPGHVDGGGVSEKGQSNADDFEDDTKPPVGVDESQIDAAQSKVENSNKKEEDGDDGTPKSGKGSERNLQAPQSGEGGILELGRSARFQPSNEIKSDPGEPNKGLAATNPTSIGSGGGPKGDGDELRIGLNGATFWTLLAGGASGFLGGLVAIRGPPLIFYFLHPPAPVSFNKTTQRATATTITFFNVTMRQIFYLYNTFAAAEQIGYRKEEWRLYLSVIAASVLGAMVGNWIFAYLKDSKGTIRAILSVFLLLSATGLLFSAFR